MSALAVIPLFVRGLMLDRARLAAENLALRRQLAIPKLPSQGSRRDDLDGSMVA